MRSPIPDYLLEVLDSCGADAGAVADYIPELAAANPERFGICVATVDGAVYAAGDADVEFTIQSMSKPFTYALALADRGVAEMDERVGVEPSGEAFNEISLDPETGRPRNAMINAGALLTHSLVDGEDAAARSQRVLAGFSRFAGRDLVVDESAFSSEFASAHRNLGMAHLLKASGVLECDPVEVVEGYTRQCSITVSCRDLAMMAATLANAGTHPLTQERLLSRPVVRQVMSVMMTCGMYDAAGDWMTDVGIPAKSGVSGGVIGALPGQVGVAVFSPRLDTHGSSVRGVQVFERRRSKGSPGSGWSARTRSPSTRCRATCASPVPRPSSGRSPRPTTRPRGWPSTSPGSTACTTSAAGCCSSASGASSSTDAACSSSTPSTRCRLPAAATDCTSSTPSRRSWPAARTRGGPPPETGPRPYDRQQVDPQTLGGWN